MIQIDILIILILDPDTRRPTPPRTAKPKKLTEQNLKNSLKAKYDPAKRRRPSIYYERKINKKLGKKCTNLVAKSEEEITWAGRRVHARHLRTFQKKNVSRTFRERYATCESNMDATSREG